MTDGTTMVQFDHVYKRYNRGGRAGSLRDAIPALAGRVVGRQRRAEREGAAAAARAFWAVRDVNFAVREGEALGIIGHNGAGKSTILKLLAGVTAPSRGHARVNGRFAALIELGAGFHPDLTGRENVYLNGSILGLKRAEIDRKFDSIVDFAGIETFIDTPVKRYSSGMQARLGFAVAAHVEPEVLLIDEVLSVGDFAFQQKCFKRMEEFRKSGIAIVFVTHNLNAMALLCSKAIMMRAGEVVASGAPMAVIDAYANVEYDVVSDDDALAITHMEHGRISRHLEIVRVDIVDADGRPARAFQSRDRATIALRLRAHRDIDEPIVGITLRNSAGVTVYDTNSAYQRHALGVIRAGEDLVVSFPLALHLCDGTYGITAGAAPSKGTVLFDWRENSVQFDIYSDQKGIGIADLQSAIESHTVSARNERGVADINRVVSV